MQVNSRWPKSSRKLALRPVRCGTDSWAATSKSALGAFLIVTTGSPWGASSFAHVHVPEQGPWGSRDDPPLYQALKEELKP